MHTVVQTAKGAIHPVLPTNTTGGQGAASDQQNHKVYGKKTVLPHCKRQVRARMLCLAPHVRGGDPAGMRPIIGAQKVFVM